MGLDPVINFGKVTVSAGYDSADTSIDLSAGDGAKLPDPSADGEFNLVWFNSSDYKDPADDPNVEIIRVTGISSDTLTIERAQEDTTAKDHNLASKTYLMFLSITKKMIDDIPDNFLKLDQTTPQTIASGIPLLDAVNEDFTDQNELVNKRYVDSAVATVGTRFYMLDAADGDVAAYKQTALSASAEATASVSASVNAEADTIIEEWISPTGLDWTTLQQGVYDLNVFVEKTGGNRDVRVFWRFYERKADTSEVLIATSNLGDLVTDKERQRIYATLASDYTPSAGSRLVGKVYFNTDGGSQNTTCVLYYRGDEGSHWQIPVSQDFLDDTYAAIDQTMYIGTTQVAINRGTAALTLAGLTLTTPDIGTPSAGVLTNATGLPVTGLANGTDGELITWSAAGVATTVAAGDATQVLTSNGAGAAPTFQDASGGVSQLSDLSDVGVTTATDKNALMADGDSWESRALVEADISDLGTYAPTTAPTFATSITGSYLTASEMLITDGDKKIVSAAVATYPSLTELAYVKGVTSGIQTQIGNKAAKGANSDITSITGLTTALTIAQGGIGATSLASASIPTYTSTNTLTNKRITQRVGAFTSDATPDINSDSYDAITITALAVAITDVNMSGTGTNFQKLLFRIKDNGTARAIAWGSDFEAKGVALPTTTVISKVLTVGFIYDTVTAKWGCVAVANEA